MVALTLTGAGLAVIGLIASTASRTAEDESFYPDYSTSLFFAGVASIGLMLLIAAFIIKAATSVPRPVYLVQAPPSEQQPLLLADMEVPRPTDENV
ncbi:hypothetical protein EOG37_04460 [Clavibacter michiganensis subsp. michiganensis]|nr:hypothetical protein [Clavibacter michiganensis]KAF0258090.1 hypothetical protein DOU02_10215 [Clavibacter michiganensis subsp. michiganensis]MBE3079338.1 hypothetical protein [Clavibacter michiganensis subsp. michiganensis]MBW8025935.1 hypothetical protein [Clavibacter michiganensis subsp. michiganensis]MWJ79868.1 hypothetical protein [Clavibacter michiganensis subsp. michiganensis]